MITRILLLSALLAASLVGCGTGNVVPILPPPPRDTLRTIQGQVLYLPTSPDLRDRDPAGRLLSSSFVVSTFPIGAPHVVVEILRPDGTLLGTGLADDAGSFSIPVNFGSNAAATQIHVRTRAELRLPFGTVVRVLPNAGISTPYTAVSPLSGNPADSVMEADVTIGLAEGSGAWHIAEKLYDPFILARTGILVEMPNLDVYWEPGNGDRSFFAGEPGLGKLTIAGGIAGDPASNQDVWDESQIVRLLGLYLLHYFFNEVGPAGTPSDHLLIPSVAWREGFLDWWSCTGRGSALFWDTEGIGASGRVVRFFIIESFFDPALGSLGPGDPNVYQDPTQHGIGSRHSIAELLWDIHDHPAFGDRAGLQYPVFLTLRYLRNAVPGFSYPYVVTILNEYTRTMDIDPRAVDGLLRMPEDQGFRYPATSANGGQWPPAFPNLSVPNADLFWPYDHELTDLLDTTGDVNAELGILSQRYFFIRIGAQATVRLTLDSAAALHVDFLDLRNALIASGSPTLTIPSVQAAHYVARVRSTGGPQSTPFKLRLELSAP
ncbi:MAG: hypothetical protein ACT4PV_10125 [Planctomycetaceae bacterium]